MDIYSDRDQRFDRLTWHLLWLTSVGAGKYGYRVFGAAKNELLLGVRVTYARSVLVSLRSPIPYPTGPSPVVALRGVEYQTLLEGVSLKFG